jgi:hypothetical protein
MVLRAVFVLWALFSGMSYVEGATFHAVMVCDTQGDYIGPSVEADLTHVKQEFYNISLMTGMQLNQVIYSGNGIDGDILRNIDRLEVGSDDVIFFYFSGHGYRTQSKGNNQWPNLYLTPIKCGIDLLDVMTLLRNKRPRLILAIADCCNNVMTESYAPPVLRVTKKALMLRSIDVHQNYRQLFVSQKGMIVMSGCVPGQVSWGTEIGGVYTVSFFHSLNQEAYTSFNPSWQVLLDRASLNVINKKMGQTPQYELQGN